MISPAKELRAIHQIIGELIAEGTPDQDPQLVQARDLQDRITTQFLSTVRETFTTLYYPAGERLANADFLMEFTANRYRGEEQIVKTLAGKQKYTEDVSKRRSRRSTPAPSSPDLAASPSSSPTPRARTLEDWRAYHQFGRGRDGEH